MPKHNHVVSVAEFNEVVLVPHTNQTASPVRRLLVRCNNNVVLGTVIYRLHHLSTVNQPIQLFVQSTNEEVLFVPVFLLFLRSLVVMIPLNISANSAILLGFLELFFFFFSFFSFFVAHCSTFAHINPFSGRSIGAFQSVFIFCEQCQSWYMKHYA